MRRAIYPGSFNPITNGHVDLVERAGRLFDQVLVGVASSAGKAPLFSLQQRVELCVQSLEHLDNVEVDQFDGLVIDFAASRGGCCVIRGVCSQADFDYEMQMADMNRAMDPQYEMVLLTPAQRWSSISSSLVREIAEMGGDVSGFVPPPVVRALADRFG